MANNCAIPDITVFLPILCQKYKFKQNVVVHKDLSKAVPEGKSSKTNRATSKMISQVGDKGSMIAQSVSCIDLDAFTVQCSFDFHDKLKEFKVENKTIPLLLMKIFTLIFRFYPELTKITFKRCQLDQFSLGEVRSMIENYSNITALCLDDTNCSANNYDILLEIGQLKSLSLSRCNIMDGTCRDLFNNLRYPETASKHLQVLDLTSNGITDASAEYIAKGLESNRSLRYLNLSGNGFTDKGAVLIFNCFAKFPISKEALIKRRVLYFHYLVKKKMLYEKAQKLRNETDTESIKSKIKSNKNDMTLEFDTDTAADEKFVHPFDKNNVSHDGNHYYCNGNFALAYLNIAYNNLGYLALKRIKDVLVYQSEMPKSIGNAGLIKIVLEGNPLPKCCSELTVVNHLLEKSLERSCNNYGLRRGSLQLRKKK